MRGSNTVIVAGPSWQRIFDTALAPPNQAAADAPATAAGLEADAANTARVLVRWTHGSGRVNYLTLKDGGDYKIIRAGRNQIVKIEIYAAAAQSVWFDLLTDEN